MTNRKKILLTLSMILGLNTTTLMAELTQTQLNATLGIVTNFILNDGITHNGTTYKTVTSPYTGRVWLDRNLGADRVCTSFDDTQCYGDYYQWGRNFDGHQDSGSGTTTTLATDVNNVGHGNFIINANYPNDWTSTDNNGSTRTTNWFSKDGISVCPVGFRVPTLTELKAETIDNGVTNNATAFTNFLKLPSAGGRDSADGTNIGIGNWGIVRTVTSIGLNSQEIYFSSVSAVVANSYRADGYSVRCIKAQTHKHNGKVYEEVISPYTGRVWLDRNLGADRVCTSFDDTQCYGDYYQWGRNFDGHQESNSSTTATLATDVSNAGSSFITSIKFGPPDWASSDSNGSQRSANWSKTDGSSVCPIGFRVPTTTELQAETVDNTVANNTTAFNNFLKLPSAGYRSKISGVMIVVGFAGGLWTASFTSLLYFDSGTASLTSYFLNNGSSVRCIKN